MTAIIENEALIRETAYLFWLDEGQPEGRDEEHWLRAVAAVNQPVAKTKAKPARKAAAKPRAAAAKKTAKPKAKAKVAKTTK
ncbi:MAG: DUF2934 domain-containing protein [Yoonia sp.]|uniref:DUF2934 domain-containing protein n=1 Tax=Yoonia sp. TaxID=2212373 RepID=UPI0032987FB3